MAKTERDTAVSGTDARHRGRTAPFLNRPVDLLRVSSALCRRTGGPAGRRG